MNNSLTQYFCDPYDKQALKLYTFKAENENIIDGIFLNIETSIIYPINKGVPIFIKNRIPKLFFDNYQTELEKITSIRNIKDQVLSKSIAFSFSEEWKEAHAENMTTVWGQSSETRLNQHYIDTKTNATYYHNKMVVDIGCGNGILTHQLSTLGATVFGVDYSTSVWNAHATYKNPLLCYLQCDLHYLPFKNNFFDLLYSNGVLHHTPNTYNAFQNVIGSVKSDGKCYIWLYSRSLKLGFNLFLYATDAMRFVVNKLNATTQKLIIEKLLALKIRYNAWRGTEIPSVIEAKIDLYDILTPTYKFYHTETEVKHWYLKNNFDKIETTHLNPYGFGMLGVKK